MPKKTNLTLKALIFWVIIGTLFGWQLNSSFGSEASGQSVPPDNIFPTNADMELFWNVWEEISESYIDVEEIDGEVQIFGAIGGLVDSLDDPYSVFMDPEESKSFASSLNGELEGIGAELTVRDSKLIIVSPLKDSPAERAGVLPGDHIYLVDEEPTSEMTIWEAIMKIRGEPGTQVTLTILREGEEEPLEIPITRESIFIPSVDYEIEELDGKRIAYVPIYQFGNDTYSEFKAVARNLILEDVDGIVLDLRLNGGGYLEVSIEVLGEFFEEELSAVIVKKRNTDDEIMYTNGNGSLSDVPLVVLIDEGSASASEIVAGAIQDHERGLVLGEQSFGKGSVQELNPLRGGSTLRLTIAKWYTPADRTIDEVGITPDQLIEMETEAIDTENDIQLQAALDYLSNL